VISRENTFDKAMSQRLTSRHLDQVGSSCGFSMPFFYFKAFRPTLNEFFEKRVAADVRGNHKDGIER
jgi:hypothetical protein